ncbi:MAG TPA: type II toxin-antitoxin system RelE/ParE family toxin [Kofleriaceae bacterium]|jgi:plasmid stabilization system protein ParE
MTRKVVRSEAAVEDMLAIADDLVSSLGMDAALAADARLEAAIESLDDLAHRGRVVPELRARGITIYRELIVLPYRILYRVETREVLIVAVLDHRRDLDTLLQERTRRDRGT